MTRVRVFVNERPVHVAPGASVRDAVTSFDPDLASMLRSGTAYVTDGVGRPVEESGSLDEGAILRVVRSARR